MFKMNKPRLYGASGAINDNGAKLSHQNKDQNRASNFMAYNMPSPYRNPSSNYGMGPQIYNTTQEVLNAPDKNVFWKDPVLREPTKNNPFMNVMPMDYDSPSLFSDYNRYEGSSNPSSLQLGVRNEVKNNFEKGLIQNADSLLWNRLNSQRQFISQPVGSVPNNQGEFASFLYGVKNVCKHGSIYQGYGVEYTDDSLVCNGFNVAEPTNMGLLNGNFSSSVYGYGQ